MSYTAIQIRAKTRLDDSLDVFSCHGLAGVAGALLTGVFATKLANPAGGDGWLAGNFAQMGVQLVAILAAVAIAAVGTVVILALVQATLGAKAGVREQLSGLDLSEHGEEAYFGEQGATPSPGVSLGQGTLGARSERARRRSIFRRAGCDALTGRVARPGGDRFGRRSRAAQGRRCRLAAEATGPLLLSRHRAGC